MAESSLNAEQPGISKQRETTLFAVPDVAHTEASGGISSEQEPLSAYTRSSTDVLITPPPGQKSWSYSFFLTLATMVGGLSSVCIKQLLLPIQVSIIAPTNTNTSFTIVASVGAFAGLLAAPLSGALSDRTTLRWGRRRPWIVCGIIATVTGMLMMAGATTIPTLLLGEIIAQVGVDTILATVTALLPDQVPPSQRSLISAFVGLAPNVGGVLGLVLVTHLTNTRIVSEGYILMAGVSAVCVVLFLVILRERPIAREALPPFHLGRFLLGFVHPLTSPNFVYVLLSRCFVYLSFTLLGAYLLFYLHGGLHFAIPVAAAGVTTFQLTSTGMLLIVAIFTGILSERMKRLKPFVFIGALLMALGLFLMVFLPTWFVLLLSAGIFGCGFGLYLGVDIALAVRVLPSDAQSGKDLGIMYMSIFLSLLLSPIIGGTVLNLSHNNFTLLFAIAAFSSVLAAVLILPMKTVR